MDQHRQLERREQQRKASSSRTHHRTERHGKHADHQPQPSYNDATRVRSRNKSTIDLLLHHSLTVPTMNEDAGYVRRWLTQTDGETLEDQEKYKPQQNALGKCTVSIGIPVSSA